MDATILIERAKRLKALVEANINIDVRGIQQDAKVKAYQDAIAAGKSEAEAQNAEAAAGNTAGANALGKVDLNNPSTYINQPGQQAGPSSEAQRQEWMKDPTQAAAPAGTTTPKTAAPKAQGQAGVLNVGSQGPEVSALQKKLGITADGKYGPATQQAVMALQKKLGVTVDGAYGPITKAAHDKMAPGQGAQSTQSTQPGYTTGATKSEVQTGAAKQAAGRAELSAQTTDPDKTSLNARVTTATPVVPVDPTNPSGVGAKAELTPDQAAVRKDILSQPTDAAGNTTDATGTIYKRDLEWMKKFGQNGTEQPQAQPQAQSAPVAQPQAQSAPVAQPQAQSAPVAQPQAPAGETGGGASTAYRVRTPKGAAAQNQVRESLDRILYLATYLK